MACSPANGLDQGALSPQEAFFVGIEDRHQAHLRQVETLPQQVHPHQHVVFPQAQILDDLDPLDRMDLRVQVAHPHLVLRQVIGEVFRHPLGEGGDQHPLVLGRPIADLSEQIVHLTRGGPHLHHRIEHPGGADHLLSHLTAAHLHLPIPRGGGDEHCLPRLLPELGPLQRPVVRCAGQAEAVLDQHLLAGLVAVVHRLQLRAGDVALVHDQQPVVREIINQALRRGALFTPGQMTGVVLHPVAVAHLAQHLQVVLGALLQPLGLQQLAFAVEHIQPLPQL